MARRSIRFRLTLWYAVVLMAALALFGALTWISLRASLHKEIDRGLAARAAQFQNYLQAELAERAPESELRDELNEFCQALPSGSYVAVRSAGGFVFRYPLSGGPSSSVIDPHVRWLRRPFFLDGERFDFETATPTADLEHTLALLKVLLWSLLPMVVTAASLGGWWLSGRALRPVAALTLAAHQISVENLERRLPQPQTGDELARLTQVLNGMLDRLESAVATLSQFAEDASHELRTPVAIIRTTAELALRRERPSESYRDSLQEIQSESERMTALIEDLLSLARGGITVAEMPFEQVDLGALIEGVAAEMRPLAKTREVRIVTDYAAGGEARNMRGNRSALHRLFVLLVDNAVKYSNPQSEVRVSARTLPEGIEIAVEDSGIGISSADLPRIFRRFYRADRSRSSVGYGLGLALAENIARVHGASIRVESTEGAGSVFRVIFHAQTSRASENLQAAQV